MSDCPEFPHFGARYPDARCIDGYLWDLDSCEVPGGPLLVGGDDPCPFCNRELAVERLTNDLSGDARYPTWRERRKEARRRLREFCAKRAERAAPGRKA